MNLPIGSIIAWDNDTIPTGWQLCDGTNDTPDLRDKFVRGANNDTDLLGTGGGTSHTHTNSATDTGNSHSHGDYVVNGNSGNSGASAVVSGSGATSSGNHTHYLEGTVQYVAAHSHTLSDTNSVTTTLPPYIKLYFIMRMV